MIKIIRNYNFQVMNFASNQKKISKYFKFIIKIKKKK